MHKAIENHDAAKSAELSKVAVAAGISVAKVDSAKRAHIKDLAFAFAKAWPRGWQGVARLCIGCRFLCYVLVGFASAFQAVYEQPGIDLSEREKNAVLDAFAAGEKNAVLDAFAAGLLDGVLKANHPVRMWPAVTRFRAEEAEALKKAKEAEVAQQIREQRKQLHEALQKKDLRLILDDFATCRLHAQGFLLSVCGILDRQ